MEIYFDNAATTQVLPEVRDIMVRVMETDFGNPSSKHNKGVEAERYIRQAKEILSGTLKCKPQEIYFTSGGTESNNMALLGTVAANRRGGKHIITTQIEHSSVHEPLAYLEELGYEVTYLPVDSLGHLNPAVLANAVRDDTLLVSVMYVNNEIGAVMDIPGSAKSMYCPECRKRIRKAQGTETKRRSRERSRQVCIELSAKNDRLTWNSVKAGSKGRAICSQRWKSTVM